MNLICGSRVKGALMTATILCLVTLLTLQTNRVHELSGLAGSVLMPPQQSFSSWKGQVEERTSSSSSSSSTDLVGNTITTTNTTSGENYVDDTDPLKSEDYNNNNNNNNKDTTSPTSAEMDTDTEQRQKKSRKWTSIQYQKDQVKPVEWTEAMSEMVREEMAKREAGVEEACKSPEVQKAPKIKTNKVVKKLMHVKDRQMMWCPVFKAASTTWSKNLLRLARKKNTGAFQHTARRLYPPPDNVRELQRLSNDTTWLMIVRHPLQRLLSAYRDKMLRQREEKDSFVKLQKHVAATYQDPNKQTITTTTTTTTTNNNNNTTINAKPSHVPTFTQFLMKVRDDVEKAWKGIKIHVNQHWSPYWLLCAPCQLHYHLIAHVETFTRDQEYLIHRFHMEDQAVNIHSHASNFDSYEGTDEATQHYFSQVPKELLNQIIQLYLPDFILFDYSPDEYLKLLPSVQSSTNEH
ncbi:hypothetical protein Pmani_020362 [Petrolisthes manimaculis]|uniref:Carbohydrate sulfotransferase n=1 Tax=Petrolisthes manimaculis TaxID=1843537 RepID=A0AAE1PGE2_9EUCA|nr:hypothetical protein Pmani_020362 [Petrolisthes manimaculis]